MIRPNKFRVYNTKQNKWVYGPSNEVDLFGEIILLGEFMQNVPPAEWNDCVALQFTDCHDSSNKEIYEKDILEYNNGNRTRIGYVGFMAGIFFLNYNDETDDELGYLLISNLKVIGNIFDTPQLLK
jgi:hypothetical protein